MNFKNYSKSISYFIAKVIMDFQNFLQMLNKKDKTGDSPDIDQPQLLTPGTMERYRHIDHQFNEMMSHHTRVSGYIGFIRIMLLKENVWERNYKDIFATQLTK